MALDFPANPTLNQIYTSGGRTWKYNNTGWQLVPSNVYLGNITEVTALDIDCGTSNFFTKTINGNSIFTVSNVPTGGVYSFVLELTHTSGTITWWSGVTWPYGITPTLTTGKVHLFSFLTDDAGGRWRASVLPDYTP